MPSPESQIIYYDFEGSVAGYYDIKMINQHTAEEISKALLDYQHETNDDLIKAIVDRFKEPNKAVFKAMAVRIKQLKEDERNKKKNKQQWALVIAGFILTVLSGLLIPYLIKFLET
jgi:hypothetical protein